VNVGRINRNLQDQNKPKNYNLNTMGSEDKRNVSYLNERESLNHSNIVRTNTSNSRKLIENKIRENSQNRKNESIVSNSFLMRRKNNN
jgi:hypothetical protein